MFDAWKSEKTLFRKLRGICSSKSASSNDSKQIGDAIRTQLRLLEFLDSKSEKVDRRIVLDMAAEMSDTKRWELVEKLLGFNSSQERAFIDSIQQEIRNIVDILNRLRTNLQSQLDYINQGNTSIQNLLVQESAILEEMAGELREEATIREKLKKNLSMAQELEHSDLFKRLQKAVCTLIVCGRFKIIVTGLENIPRSGPVIIASKHINRYYDPMLLEHVMPRKLFFIGAKDFMEGAQLKIGLFLYKLNGTIPVDRPDSIFQKGTGSLLKAVRSVVRLLTLNQAIITFPEGYTYLDGCTTEKPDADGFYTIKLGLFHFVDYAQKKNHITIPIIPVGLRYEGIRSLSSVAFVNIGKPLYLPIRQIKSYKEYAGELLDNLKRLTKAK